jgi:hypothetical protein
MHAQRWEIVSQARRGTRIATLQVSNDCPQPTLSVSWIGSLLEGGPVRSFELLALLGMAEWQLG